ncbi:hypothetical protein ASPWEDRAFT_118931 [Aspergillus wentii DTO 134E9]|uniref:Arabinan endo-1,5-alpha-L-arabinosidase n=1 Tax=Aspergillus wentii DTO 134E9 TaxID=1073089 RepID=A0A1L9R8L8_ASPWE|nr:uncharacterized protein ASPWEDRAFT_118931 [Aspergillus wentii DTO 134E9]OJJ31261.1 hypothetical protein ASPWEDRAFT_118931 [Aspergillus wentii DTO 134E9]
MSKPLLAAAAALSIQSTLAIPHRVLDTNFPDPSLIKTHDGFYSFATSGNGVNAQIAFSSDFTTWELQKGKDALPGPFPEWVAEKPSIWAPDVAELDDGSFVMYFSATAKGNSSKHCVGTATARSVTGPYTPNDKPLACPIEKGGAIDPAGFNDGGKRYVVYKVDGNSLNKKGSTHPTPLMLQPVKSDGVTPDGEAIQLLDRDSNDGPLIEAPSLAKGKDGTYYLSFSSNMYNTKKYDVSYATAKNIKGPWTKASDPNAPLLKSGDSAEDGKLAGPGGSSFVEGGKGKILFHAFRNGEDMKQGRAVWAADIVLDGGKIRIS